jgi:uncharacterized protein (TIGR02147 family)
MKIPNIKNFYCIVDYFSSIYQVNKALKKSFSHRMFARKVKWPGSYLSDIIKGRKKITISRCLQFAQVFKLSHAETEYLLSLCLADYEDENVSSYFKESVINKNIAKEKMLPFKSYLNLFDNIRGMYLRELILWGQGRIPVKELVKAQIPFPELMNDQVLNETLDFLLSKKLIKEIKPAFYVVIEAELFTLDDDDFTIKNPGDLANHYIHQLEILNRLYKFYKGNGFSFSGYIDITKERYPELQKRMFELRDWIISLSKEKKSDDLNKNETYQVELHCLPMFDFKKIPLFSE